jgi:beta-glucosidase
MFRNTRKCVERVIALALSIVTVASLFSLKIFASTSPKPTTPMGIASYELALQTELESILLLRNEARAGSSAKMLPLGKADDTIAIFGRGQTTSNAGSGGSGATSGRYTYNFSEGLAEIEVPSERRISVSSSGTWNKNTEYPGKWGTAQASNTGWNQTSPIQTAENKYSDNNVSAAAARAKTAVVFLMRAVGTEEMDRASNPPQPSDWYLNPSELHMLAQAATNFDDIVLVINASGSMDMTWLDFKWMQTGSADYYSANGMYNGDKVQDASALADKINSIVWSYGNGSHYGLALAQLLYGDESFSAKLADTIAYDWYDYFTSKNFGGHQTYADNGAKLGFSGGKTMNTRIGASDPVTIYQEDVYSGHRYFDTFMGDKGAADPVAFPFGFGLTYADFAFSDMSIAFANETLTVNAKITNTAGLAGKEVMQAYVSKPNDKTLDQPYQELVGYDKTRRLAESEADTLSIDVPAYYLASYDEARAAYILEEGDYIVRVGDSSRNTAVAGILRVDNGGQPIIVERLKNRLTLNAGGFAEGASPPAGADPQANKAAFDAVRLNSKTTTAVSLESWNGDSRTLPAGSLPMGDTSGITPVAISASQIATVVNSDEPEPYAPGTAPTDKAYTLQAVKQGFIGLGDFVAQMTDDELVPFLTGGTNSGPDQAYSDEPAISLRNTDTALSKPSGTNDRWMGAGSSRSIQRLGIPSITYTDGSNGIFTYLVSSLWSNVGIDQPPGYARAAGMACTWNPELQYKWGEDIGKTMVKINTDVWLAPSINLHRNPLNGRNTEYYSEDPFLSGLIAAEVSKGVASQGVTVCLKHFAANEQEHYRRGFHSATSDDEGASKDAINSIMSERALREVSLKAYELAVRTGTVRTVMSAFNKINGQFASASMELLTHILRGEWGFSGFVVTDWGTCDEIPNTADMMRAGNDMVMSGEHNRVSFPDQLWNGLREIPDYDGVPADPPKGALHPVTRDDLQRNAFNALSVILDSPLAFNADGTYNTDILNGSILYHLQRPLSIQNTGLPAAVVGVDYKTLKANPLLAAGNEGTASYTFAVDGSSAAQLPAGMALSGNGAITGTPAAGTEGFYSITFRATDSDGNVATKTLGLEVEKLVMNTAQLNEFRLGVPFAQTFDVTASSAVTFSLANGALPGGIALDPATGRLSGALSEADVGKSFSFVIRASSGSDSVDFVGSAVVKDYIDITTPAENGISRVVGTALGNINLAATRNISGDAFVFGVEGTLPAGVSFNSANNRISGTPSQSGVFPIQISASLAADPGIKVAKDYVITVLTDPDPSSPKIFTESLPFGKAGSQYSTQILAAGGSGATAYSIVSDQSSAALPTGLAINNSGVLSCWPALTESGLYKVAIRYSRATGGSATQALDLYIAGVLNSVPIAGATLNVGIGEAFLQTVAVSGGFSEDYRYELDAVNGDALPAGLVFADNQNRTAQIAGTPAAGAEGAYRIAIKVNETFAGSPTDTVLYYRLVVGGGEESQLNLNAPTLTYSVNAGMKMLTVNHPSIAKENVEAGLKAYYTTDGSEPDASSQTADIIDLAEMGYGAGYACVIADPAEGIKVRLGLGNQLTAVAVWPVIIDGPLDQSAPALEYMETDSSSMLMVYHPSLTAENVEGGLQAYYTTDGSEPSASSETAIIYDLSEYGMGIFCFIISPAEGTKVRMGLSDQLTEVAVWPDNGGGSATKASIARDGGNAVAKYSVVNPSADRVTVICIIAVYDANGRLTSIRSEKLEVAANASASHELSAELKADSAAKAFIWDESYKPVCPAATLE